MLVVSFKKLYFFPYIGTYCIHLIIYTSYLFEISWVKKFDGKFEGYLKKWLKLLIISICNNQGIMIINILNPKLGFIATVPKVNTRHSGKSYLKKLNFLKFKLFYLKI